jgi:hypothetical protein
MSQLQNDVNRRYQVDDLDFRTEYSVDAAATIYAGSLVGLDSATGGARQLVAGDDFIGIAVAKAVNVANGNYPNLAGTGGILVGSFGATQVEVRTETILLLPLASVTGAVGYANIGNEVYATDGNTFTMTVAGGASQIGTVETYLNGNLYIQLKSVTASKGLSGLIFSLGAASAALTNTTTTTAFASYAIPANTLDAGDVIRIRAQGIQTAVNSTNTLTVKLTIGSTTIVTTAAVNAAANDEFYLDTTITIRTNGASGTLVAASQQSFGTPGTATLSPSLLGSTAIDTTVAETIAVQGTFSVASSGNSARLDTLTIERLVAA